MTTFALVPGSDEDFVQFSCHVDKEGDFYVYANGHKLLYIDAVEGRLWRMLAVDPIDGLDINNHRITMGMFDD